MVLAHIYVCIINDCLFDDAGLWHKFKCYSRWEWWSSVHNKRVSWVSGILVWVWISLQTLYSACDTWCPYTILIICILFTESKVHCFAFKDIYGVCLHFTRVPKPQQNLSSPHNIFLITGVKCILLNSYVCV